MMDNMPPSWVSWQDYVDGHIMLLRREMDGSREALLRQLDERFRAQEMAVRAYSENNLRALEKVNEFRASMDDQTRRFATSERVDGVQSVLETRHREGAAAVAKLESAFNLHLGADEEAHRSNRNLILWVGLVLAALELGARFLWR